MSTIFNTTSEQRARFLSEQTSRWIYCSFIVSGGRGAENSPAASMMRLAGAAGSDWHRAK